MTEEVLSADMKRKYIEKSKEHAKSLLTDKNKDI